MMLSRINKVFTKYKLWICIGLPIIVVGVLLDMAVKDLVFWLFKVEGRAPFEIIKGILKLTYTENDGAAFSMLVGQRWLFVVLTVVALAVAVFAIIKEYVKGPFGVVSLSLVLSGAIGNFIDRLFFGYVVDMFETVFIDFAIFNVADVFLTVGGVMLAVYLLFFSETGQKKELQ